MGNIVSNPGTPIQVPDTQSTGSLGAAPSLPPQQTPQAGTTSQEHPNPSVIEGVGQTAQPTGFGIDPFGPLAKQGGELPGIELSTAQSTSEPPSITPEPPPPPPEEPAITPPLVESRQGNKIDSTTLLNKIPSVNQMMKDLERSGCLLPELNVKAAAPVDNSPLAALQPHRSKDPNTVISTPTNEVIKPILPEVQLATTSVSQPKVRKDDGELPLFVFTAIISLVQAIQGAAQVVHFALIRYPQYEELIKLSQLTTTDVNSAVIKAVLIAFLAIVTLFISFGLVIKRSKNHSAFLYVSVIFIIFNFFAQNFMVGGEFVTGSPLFLPSIISEIISSR